MAYFISERAPPPKQEDHLPGANRAAFWRRSDSCGEVATPGDEVPNKTVQSVKKRI